jgi:glycosyltransferase involved in cell wall biosynthesis
MSRPPARVLLNALALHASADAARIFLENLVRELPRCWPEATIGVILRHSQPAPTDLGIEAIRIRSPRSGIARVADEALRLPEVIRRWRPDVMINPNESIPPRMTVPLLVVAQNLVFHCPGVGPLESGSRRAQLRSRLQFAFYRWAMPRAYARADAVVPVSEHAARELAENAGLDLSRVHVVPYGADRLPVRPRRSVDGTRRILVVGTLARYKRLECAIEALRLLLEERGDYALDLAGSEWPGYGQVLRAVASAAGVRERVTFLGPVRGDALAELFANSHAGLALSRCESFGIPVVEGMRAGLPHVVADEPWSAETVGDAAVRVQGSDARSIAAGIRRLEDPDEWARMATSGCDVAVRYTWKANAAGITRVAASLVDMRA